MTTSNQDFIELTEDEFDEQYPLIVNPFRPTSFNGCLFDTHDEEYAFVAQHDLNCIWTLLEDGDGNSFISSGLHFVNRLGYFVSEKPVPEGKVIEVHW